MARKLTEEQRLMVEDAIRYVGKVAKQIWDRVDNTFMYDDLRSEAFLEMCRCAINYRLQKEDFARIVGSQIRKYLWRYVMIELKRAAKQGDQETLKQSIAAPTIPCKHFHLDGFDLLTDRQKQVITLRCGLEGEPLSTSETANKLGLKRDEVLYSYRSAIQKLQSANNISLNWAKPKTHGRPKIYDGKLSCIICETSPQVCKKMCNKCYQKSLREVCPNPINEYSNRS